jgi:hypothetical protein
MVRTTDTTLELLGAALDAKHEAMSHVHMQMAKVCYINYMNGTRSPALLDTACQMLESVLGKGGDSIQSLGHSNHLPNGIGQVHV